MERRSDVGRGGGHVAGLNLDRVALFGASGATGAQVLRIAKAHDIQVRALVRREGSVRPEPPVVEVVAGSLSSADDVERALEGCKAAVCVFGPRPPYVDVFCHEATRTIVAAMRRRGVRRLVCLTGGMAGEWPTNRTLPFELLCSIHKRRVPAAAADRAGQERTVIGSGLDWTLVKPPMLTNHRGKERWLAGPEVRLGLFSSIPRADLAAFLLEEALEPEHLDVTVFIKSGPARRPALTGTPLTVEPTRAPLRAALT